MTASNKIPKIQLTGADMVIKALVDANIDHIFGYPGGAVLPIYDSLFKQNKLRHTLVRHEQAALHAAEGYARSTGKLGAALVTSGPGATNAVTGLADAFMDSIPVICLTGQVPTHMIGNDAFQECDITGITRPCTKHNYLVRDINKLANVLHEAMHVATSGRPGPVLVDLPKDILFATGNYQNLHSVSTHPTYRPIVKAPKSDIDKIVQYIAKAKKPIVYAGGGIINSGTVASNALRKFVDNTGFPCTLTLMGLGALPASHKSFLGMLGMHGTYEANMAMHDSDLILAFGSRFDDRITGKLEGFAPNAKKIHVDIDPSSINKNVKVDLPVIGDVGKVLQDINKSMTGFKANKEHMSKWWKQIEGWRSKKCLAYVQKNDVILPQHAIKRLGELTKKYKPFVTTDVGQHQMWTAQLFPFEQPNHFMTSGGLGTMGYGLPAAIGAQTANPGKMVIAVTGEGSIQMNIQELATAIQHRLPVKIVIINNRYLGMVRQWQELLHGSRYSASYSETIPDFVKLAESYGGLGLRASKPSELDEVYQKMIEAKTFVLVDVLVKGSENCYPMIPSGACHNEILLGDEKEGKSLKQGNVSEDGMVLV